MASYTEFFCHAGISASNLNGGGLVSGADPTDLAAYTGVGDSDGTSKFTPSDGSTPASSVNVGDFASIYVTIGATVAVFIGRVTVVAAGVNGAITVSTTAKSGTIPASSGSAHTITCKVGGAWAGPNAAVSFPFGFITAALMDAAGDYPRVNLKSGTTYSITAAMTHSLAGPVYFQGYTTTAGDGGKATIDGGTSGASYVLLTLSGAQGTLRDLIFQNNGATAAVAGLSVNNVGWLLERVTVNSVRGSGFTAGSGSSVTMVECEAYACNQSNTASRGGFFFNQGTIYLDRCIAHDNTGSNNNGFCIGSAGGSPYLVDCVADTNGAAGFLCSINASAPSLENCVAYNNTTAGILVSGNNQTALAENCRFTGNLTYGVNNSGTGNIVRLSNCAFRSNTSGQTNGVVDATGSITLTADEMVDPANGDFSLNNNAGGGAACRAAGRGNFTQAAGSYTKTTVSFPDVGAAQVTDVAYSRSLIQQSIGTY